MKLKIKDIEIFYKIVGKGKPIVVLHGLGLDHRIMTGCMEPIFKNLNGWQRIYLDFPGMGKTKASDWIQSSDQMLDITLKFIQKIIPKKRFSLVGFSYGGYIAQGVSYKKTKLLDRLLLVCPVITSKRTVPKHIILKKNPKLILSLSKQEKEEIKDLNTQTKYLWEKHKKYILPALKINNLAFIEKLKNSGYYFSFDVTKFKKKLKKPVLIITGKQDSVVGYKNTMDIIDNFPFCSNIILDHAGHGLVFEQEKLFRILVKDWLKKL